jgi:hypothetical protein
MKVLLPTFDLPAAAISGSPCRKIGIARDGRDESGSRDSMPFSFVQGPFYNARQNRHKTARFIL